MKIVITIILSLILATHTFAGKITITTVTDDVVQAYALSRLKKAFAHDPDLPDTYINFKINSELSPESYKIKVAQENDAYNIEIQGNDAKGILYGSMHVIEQWQTHSGIIQDFQETARFPFRAIKFNLPWSAYRKAKALEIHKETCRDLNFWKAFLDMMVDNRFNALTLWSLHPFPYMIRNEKYPEACEFNDAELADWTTFWTKLFAMAKERGIETYMVNWNIFVSPSFSKYHKLDAFNLDDPNKHHGKGDTTDIVKDYNRTSVTQLLETYPDLTGLGVSLGERMKHMLPEEREQWILDVFVEGIKNARRDARFIHRLPFSATSNDGGSTSISTEQMTRNAIESIDLPTPILTEVKFNWSHGHSSSKLVHVHGGKLGDTYWNPPPANYQLAWMIRNEDFFCLRWCEPDFIREHVKLNGQSYVAGYFVGSECYIPAKAYMTTPAYTKGYAFERQWLFYMAWGRLLYNPEINDETFIAACKARFGTSGEIFFKALKLGSKMPLRLASFFKGTWDFSLYSEGFLSIYAKEQSRGLISVDDLINRTPLDPDYLSIPEYVESVNEGKRISKDKISPVQLADMLLQDGNKALGYLEALNKGENNSAFMVELADAKAWAYLSTYFGYKLKAAVALHLYRSNKNVKDKERAVKHIKNAAKQWDMLVEVTDPVYTIMPLAHIHRYQGIPDEDKRDFHWKLIQPLVHEEVNTIQNEK